MDIRINFKIKKHVSKKNAPTQKTQRTPTQRERKIGGLPQTNQTEIFENYPTQPNGILDDIYNLGWSYGDVRDFGYNLKKSQKLNVDHFFTKNGSNYNFFEI